MRGFTLAFATASTMLLSAASAADLKSAIDAANRQWVDAYQHGDAAKLASLYTPDAVVLPPGAEMVQGRPAIQAFWQKVIESGLKIDALQAVSVEPLGNSAAREIGRGTGHASAPVDLKYVVVWKRDRGAWRLSTDIWNMNK